MILNYIKDVKIFLQNNKNQNYLNIQLYYIVVKKRQQITIKIDFMEVFKFINLLMKLIMLLDMIREFFKK